MKRVYLITGASSDLAIAFLKRINKSAKCSSDEYVVYGTYNKNGDLLNEVGNQLDNIKLVSIACNLQDLESIDRLITMLKESGNEPTHFIHFAAAKFEYMRFKNFDWNKVKKEMDIQVGSFAYICRWLLSQMARRKYGRVVVVASAYTLGVPPKYMSNYVITKYALVGLVKALASEYTGKGISINAISPGMMKTKFLSEIDDRTIEINAVNLPMKRNISLEETVGAIEYLSSDAASYINGINLNLSGGEYM